MYIQNSPHFT